MRFIDLSITNHGPASKLECQGTEPLPTGDSLVLSTPPGIPLHEGLLVNGIGHFATKGEDIIRQQGHALVFRFVDVQGEIAKLHEIQRSRPNYGLRRACTKAGEKVGNRF